MLGHVGEIVVKTDGLPVLSSNEVITLRLLMAGHRVSRIAGFLGISDSAVKQRICNARRKLGAKTTVQCVAKAIQLGILDVAVDDLVNTAGVAKSKFNGRRVKNAKS